MADSLELQNFRPSAATAPRLQKLTGPEGLFELVTSCCVGSADHQWKQTIKGTEGKRSGRCFEGS